MVLIKWDLAFGAGGRSRALWSLSLWEQRQERLCQCREACVQTDGTCFWHPPTPIPQGCFAACPARRS